MLILLQVLLDRGADVSARSSDDSTPLMYAAAEDCWECAQVASQLQYFNSNMLPCFSREIKSTHGLCPGLSKQFLSVLCALSCRHCLLKEQK